MLRRLRSLKPQTYVVEVPPVDPPVDPLPTLVIDNIPLPFGTLLEDYPATQFTATDNVGAVDWEVISGSTNGINLNQNGLFGGPGQQPVDTGTHTFEVKGSTLAGQSATREFSIVAESKVALLAETVPSGQSGVAYTHTFTGFGGLPPYTYSVSNGTKPPGSTLNPTTGVLSGTLGLSGGYNFEVQVLDSRGRRGFLSVHIDVAPNFAISNASIPNATIGSAYTSTQLTISGLIGNPFFIADAVPQNMVVSAAGLITAANISGTAGPFTARFILVDLVTGFYSVKEFSIQLLAASTTLEITTASLAGATVGTAYTGQSIVGTGGSGTKVYSLPTKPAWLSINSSNGALTGTPTTGSHGNIPIVAQITDSSGTVTKNFTLVVAPAALVFVTTSLPGGNVGVDYSTAPTITGGAAPYSLSLVSGALPGGLSPAGASITGRPTTVQNPSFVLRATDSLGVGVNSGSLSINIAAPVVITDEQADFVRRTGLSRIRAYTNFPTSASIHDYMWQNDTYIAHPEYVQYVNAAHADAAVRIPGYDACMGILLPPTLGETAMNWVRKLNDAHTNPLDGYGQGDEIWISMRFKVTKDLAESRWQHFQGSGGWKLFILGDWNANNTAHTIVMNNGGYYNYIRGYHYDPNIVPHEKSVVLYNNNSDQTFQPAKLNLTISDHPTGKDPTVGGDLGDRRKFGGLYSKRNQNGTPPIGSDTEESGGIMWTRDCMDKWVNLQLHIVFGPWGSPTTIYEAWIALPGEDYKHKLFSYNNLRLGLDNVVRNGQVVNTAYAADNGPVNPASNPQGAHKMSALWITPYNTGVIAGTVSNPAGNDTPKIYWGEYIVRDGPAGNPAPGRISPPVSAYGIPSFVPTALGQVVRLDTAANGRPRLLDAVPVGQQGQAIVNNGVGGTFATDGRDIMNPWCSFFWDYEGRVCYGGGDSGHAAGLNSQVTIYDPNGSSSPTGWTRLDGPTSLTSVGATGNALYAADSGDSKIRWSAAHTYNGKCRTPDGRLWIIGGSGTLGSGADIIGLRSYNPNTNTYASYGNGPFNSESEHANFVCWDPAYPNVLFCYRGGNAKWAVFNITSNTWQASGSTVATGSAFASGVGGFYDPRRHRLVLMGNLTNAYRMLNFNGSGLASTTSYTGTGAYSGFLDAFAIGTCYDPELDCAWAFDLSAPKIGDGPPPADRATKIARIDLDLTASNQLNFTSHTLSGTRITNTPSTESWSHLKRGTYCSIGVMKGWNAILAHNKINEAPYLIRKPV